MSPRPRRTWLIPALLAGVLVVLVAILAVLVWPHVASGGAKPGASPRVVRNIAQPDKSCQDQPDQAFVRQWEVDGWWAGYVNGAPKQMSAGEALNLAVGGAAIDRVWLCPSRASW